MAAAAYRVTFQMFSARGRLEGGPLRACTCCVGTTTTSLWGCKKNGTTRERRRSYQPFVISSDCRGRKDKTRVREEEAGGDADSRDGLPSNTNAYRCTYALISYLFRDEKRRCGIDGDNNSLYTFVEDGKAYGDRGSWVGESEQLGHQKKKKVSRGLPLLSKCRDHALPVRPALGIRPDTSEEATCTEGRVHTNVYQR